MTTDPPPPPAHVEHSLAPTTTTQEDLTTKGQRRINLIWEVTQASLAILVTLANMIVCVIRATHVGPQGEYPVVLASAFFLIMGAYFQRTNHQMIGGIGRKATDYQKYEGR